MIQPGVYNLSADRWVACIRVFTFVGYDFTGATFKAQIRLKPDLTGSPLVDLANAISSAEGLNLLYGGSDSITNHIAAGRLTEVPDAINPATGLPYAGADVVDLSQVQLRINETTMEGLPYPGEIGDDAGLAWDLHITPSAGTKDKYLGGDFIVRAGVTQ